MQLLYRPQQYHISSSLLHFVCNVPSERRKDCTNLSLVDQDFICMDPGESVGREGGLPVAHTTSGGREVVVHTDTSHGGTMHRQAVQKHWLTCHCMQVLSARNIYNEMCTQY